MSSNFAADALELMRVGQNLWYKSPLKNDKVHFSVFFTNKYFFVAYEYYMSKLMVAFSRKQLDEMLPIILEKQKHFLICSGFFYVAQLDVDYFFS